MPAELVNWFLVFSRAGALLLVFPLTSMVNVPVQIRVAVGAMAAFLVTPALPVIPPSNLTVIGVILLVLTEIGIGLLLGFVCRMLFFGLEFAGHLMATEMGLTLSSSFNPLGGAPLATTGLILYWLALMLLLTLDMHHWLIAAFIQSYTVLPPGMAMPGEPLLANMVARTGHTFVIGLQISAPLLAVSFMLMVVFSVLGRAVPQMNVFTENFPARLLAGLFVFSMTCTFMGQQIANYLRRLPEDLLTVTKLIAG